MGATHNAVFTELAARGHADKILVAESVDESSVCFWRFVFEKYLPMALEPVDFDATASQARFGGSAKYQFPRQGDLAWHTYAKINIPAIVGIRDGRAVRGEDAVYWDNAIGYRLLRNVTLAIGGTVIDNVTDTFMYAWDYLTGGNNNFTKQMVGKFDTVEEQQQFAKRSHTLWVPLPFSFCRDSGLALPIVALTFHQVVLEVDFCNRADAIKNKTNAQVYVRPDGLTDDQIDAGIAAGTLSLAPLQEGDLHCNIESTYVYLENEERNMFGRNAFSSLYDELQVIPSQAYYAAPGATEATPSVKHTVRLQFNNSVYEYIWVVRSEGRKDSNYFDFSGPIDKASGLVLDPVREATIKFANTPRVQTRPGAYFRLVQPYQYHKNSSNTNEFIYVWSYAQDPESRHPTGGANHNRIDGVQLELALDPRIFAPESPNAEVLVFARSKNLNTFKYGMIHKKLG
jgi:hypothetical protein